MLNTADVGDERFSETHWKFLRYFNLYRLAVAALIFFSALVYPLAFPVSVAEQGLSQLMPASLYLASTAACGDSLAYRHRRHSGLQLSASVLIDVLVTTVLTHVGAVFFRRRAGGSGLGSMLLVTLAGAGLVRQVRLVLFYVAMATFTFLFEQSYRALQNDFGAAGFFQAGGLVPASLRSRCLPACWRDG